MATYIQLEQPDVIEHIRFDYLRTLTAPMDGMWENAIISSATFWEIQVREQHAGHFCLDYNNCLLRFHLLEEYQAQAQEIFRELISTFKIQHAITSTIEPLYFSLCLDVQKSVTPLSYLFRDHRRTESSVDWSESTFRIAEKRELENIVPFYQEQALSPGEWIEAFVHTRLERAELFVWYHQQTLAAIGECIPSQRQPPYADLGMIVAQEYRGRGLGRSILIQLKQHCYEMGWKPICSCSADNLASKKAIEKAGFLSEQRMVKMTF